MIKNLYLSLEKYKMIFLKAYAEKEGINIKFTEEDKIKVVKQFLKFIGECIEYTLCKCHISPKKFAYDYKCDLRYKILAVALKRSIVIDSDKNPLGITFVLNRGEVSNLRVGIEVGSNGNLHCDYDEEDIKYSSVYGGNLIRSTPMPVEREKRVAINYIFDMITSEYLEDFVTMLNLIEALNNDAFAKSVLKINNNLEETVLPKDNYNNPHNRGFWFRVFKRAEFIRERDEYISSKLKFAEKHIENMLELENDGVLDMTVKVYNDIRWAIDYKGWEWFYTNIHLPASYFFIDEVTPLKTTKEFRRND